MSRRYEFKAIEEKWLPRWESADAWAAPRTPTREKRYVLEMYPYPSGDMHMGHVENFAGIGDAIARYWRMKGFEVLHPFGYDAFGLPAENKAIKDGIHPRDSTYANIERFTASCKRLAISYDWNRAFATCDPSYYRWNQWIFLRMFERDLAYKASAKVNWCPSCRTVLANEQISSGVCWRCSSVPVVRDLEQWFLKTSEYADRLLDDMEQLEWGEAVLTQQRNWIGRSQGAVVTFRIGSTGDEVPIFTTRPDTLWGVTFFVFAAEHPIARRLAERAAKVSEYDAFVGEVRRRTEVDRMTMGASKMVFDLEATATNPVNGEQVPVFASDYVMMEYGTGAIMAVPAHDERDHEFARQLDLEIRTVIEAASDVAVDTRDEAYTGPGRMVRSGDFTGRDSDTGRADVIAWLEEQGLGRGEVQYRLRDWLISRQRYWGTPIPIVECEACGLVAVPEDELPVELPEVVDFQPGGEDVSPLATALDWVKTSCPSCGREARRETDTMDTFVDSSWYQMRFCDPHNTETAFVRELADAWLPVDQYIGGIEHAVMHLIYARFFTKFLYDIGLIGVTEPFRRLMNQGQIRKDGQMMSKSLGNVVEPEEVLELYGADALRVFILFIGPPEDDYDWPDEGAQAVVGAYRFLERVWRTVTAVADQIREAPAASGSSEMRRSCHRSLRKITHDFEAFKFNTAISEMMTLQRALAGAAEAPPAELREGVEILLRTLAPIAPYITEELWERIGGEGSIHASRWPEADPELSALEHVTLVVQVDGKVRDRVEVAADISEADAVTAALASEKVREHLGGADPVRVIARPPRLVNLLTR